jgi:hypothetical protein
MKMRIKRKHEIKILKSIICLLECGDLYWSTLSLMEVT